MEKFILNNITDKEKWLNLQDAEKIEIISKISDVIVDNVNNRIFNETQSQDYNSQVKDFKIVFEQEIIAKTALFVKKKKYTYWCVNKDGTPVDKLEVSGLEIVRSDSSEGIRIRLKDIMVKIMKKYPEDEIINTINKYKKELMKASPEEIAANIGINNLSKYIVNGKSTKGTPWHVKGVANYRNLLKRYNIVDKYEDIFEGIKAKVIYIKKNRFNMETVSFHKWPKEFDVDVEPDRGKMIEKFFLKKIGFLLEPMGKIHLLDSKNTEKMLNLFFG